MFSRTPVEQPSFLGGSVSILAARPAIEGLRRRGVPVAPVLAAAGLSSADLADGARLPHRTIRALWEAAARAAGDRSFGLHVAERLPEGGLELLDYLVGTAATVGDGLAAVTRCARLIEQDAEWRMEGGRLLRRAAVVAPQLDELVLVWLVTRSRQATGVRWTPERVVVQHERPNDDGELRRVLGCPVELGGAATELAFAPEVLATAHLHADARLFGILAHTADARLASLPDPGDVAASVAATIAQQLAEAVPDLSSTAAAFRVTERTLQRRLAERGLSFSALLDDVRRELALGYVTETPLTLWQIAERLRFSDPTALHRAFKRWTGTAPAQYRRRLGARAA